MSTISWYAMRVFPQSEFKIQRRFNQREHPTIVPTEYKWVRKSSNSKLRTRKAYPLFVSYVFVGLRSYREFNDTKDAINTRARVPLVYGLVGFNGMPARFSDQDVAFLLSLADAAPMSILPLNPHRAIQVGGQAQIVDGPFAGRTVPVQGIVAKKARVMLELLGSMQVVEISVASLEAA